MRGALVLAAGLTVGLVTTMGTAIAASDRGDHRPTAARTTLRLADGTTIGDVRFRARRDAVQVDVELDVPDGVTAVRSFHGFHVHANDVPANGEGCLASAGEAPSTWFVSADGHLAKTGELHGAHTGDMPSLHLNLDGTAATTFMIDRLVLEDLVGRVVILHAGADNFGNVPVGTGAAQYTANSADAVSLTQRTGNAGDRIACGEIVVR